MKLIEFLIRNWYIFIILLAVYAQFRNKAGRGAREADRRTSGMPSFGGPVPSAAPTIRQSGKETSSSSLSGKPSTQQQVLRSQTKNNDRRTLIERSNERTANTQPYLEGKERSASPFSALKKGEQNVLPDQEAMGGIERLDIKLNRHQLAQGILWSEIIGPPRAKKPYRR
jgi:hypothetical protein